MGPFFKILFPFLFSPIKSNAIEKKICPLASSFTLIYADTIFPREILSKRLYRGQTTQ
jgi:hypothetical protein